jgi:hypothetical protein
MELLGMMEWELKNEEVTNEFLMFEVCEIYEIFIIQELMMKYGQKELWILWLL